MSAGGVICGSGFVLSAMKRSKGLCKFGQLGVHLFVLTLSMMFLSSCRGYFSDKPPIDLVPNMDVQPKHKVQSQADGRKPPLGTVPVSGVYEDSARVLHGVDVAGDYLAPEDIPALAEAIKLQQAELPGGAVYVARIPLPVDREFILRGMERFTIYCSVCHTRVGTGDSIIVTRGLGLPQPPDLVVERILSDGETFGVMTYGRRIMPSYALQVTVEDRWAIVAYVRALQLARTGTLADVPPAMREELRAEVESVQAAVNAAAAGLEAGSGSVVSPAAAAAAASSAASHLPANGADAPVIAPHLPADEVPPVGADGQ